MPVIVNQSIPKLADVDEKLAKSLGQFGSVVTPPSALVNGNFVAIQTLAETIFSTLTITGQTGSLVGYTLPANTVIYGVITSYALTTGLAIAYRAE